MLIYSVLGFLVVVYSVLYEKPSLFGISFVFTLFWTFYVCVLA
jgi:hypothetical protein